MRINDRDGEQQADILVGEASVRAGAGELDRLSRASGQQSDVLTSLPWFLAHNARSRELPLVVLLQHAGEACGAVLLHGRRLLGVPTGLFKGGYLCGRGSAIGPAALQPALVDQAARHLLRQPFVHTVVVTLLRPASDPAPRPDPAASGSGRWRMRETRHCLDIAGGWDTLAARFSAKMRRNLGYYRRRAERDLQCEFIPRLSPEQSRQAVMALHGLGSYPHRTAHAMQHEAALSAVPGGFAMGLRDGAGDWLSFLAGWRTADDSFIEWQLNSDQRAVSSISMAMRNYWLQHEIAAGMQRIVFVGETSPAWSQACMAQQCGDLLATREGFGGRAIQLAGQWLRPTGQVAALQRQAGGSFRP